MPLSDDELKALGLSIGELREFKIKLDKILM